MLLQEAKEEGLAIRHAAEKAILEEYEEDRNRKQQAKHLAHEYADANQELKVCPIALWPKRPTFCMAAAGGEFGGVQTVNSGNCWFLQKVNKKWWKALFHLSRLPMSSDFQFLAQKFKIEQQERDKAEDEKIEKFAKLKESQMLERRRRAEEKFRYTRAIRK